MKLIVTRLTVLTCIVMAAIVRPGHAQDVDFTEIFKAPQEDITQYLDNYIKPAMLSFANGQAGGWYNTAETHKPLGFDLTFSVNVANIPNGERKFLFNPADYTALTLQSGDPNLPTIVGGSTDAQMRLEAGDEITGQDGGTYTYNTNIDFQAPIGADVSSLPFAGVPTPTLQLGIGLFKNTDLKIRYGYLPEGTIPDMDVTVNILGFAIMHDFKQWIPGIKHVPIDMSLFVGWTRFHSTVGIDEDFPGEFTAKGETELTANSTTVQAVISKKIAVLTPYIGVGYNIVSSGVKVTGDFTVHQLEDENGNPYTFRDPVDFKYGEGSSFRATAGLRLKLAILTLHADYTFQKYNTFTAGLGFTVR